MATMATSHGQSVLTNSCVKPPINPNTGLASTLKDRPLSSYRSIFVEDNHRYDEDYEYDSNQNVTHLLSKYTTDEIATHLRQLTDEEFYNRLIELKNEQRKTLRKCEQLYHEKVAREQGVSTEYGDDDLDELFDRNQMRPVLNGHVFDTESSTDMNGFLSNGFTDQVKDLSTKPPITRPSMRYDSRPVASALHVPLKSKSFKERPSSAPARWKVGRSQSLDDDDDWPLALRSSTDDILGTNQNYCPDPDDLSGALTKIDSMWETFSIEDYVPRERRHSSASLVKKSSVQKEKDNWRHRLTIPKPFRMTLREANREKKKTSAQIDLENKRLEKEKAEEAECQKTFKASPAPAHIYLPLYDEIMEKNEARRRYVKEYCQEMLKSQEKPFNFVKREEERKKVKCNSAPPKQKVSEKMAKSVFKAKPVPDYLFDKSIDDKILEEEEYRKIRMKMRSEELLREASLPSNMEMRQRLKEQKIKERKLKENSLRSRKTKTNRTKGIHTVPDYDALFRQFQKEMSLRKIEREPTIPKPFDLSTQNFSSKQEKILRDIEKDEQTLRENRWPYVSSRDTLPRHFTGSWGSSLDAIPSRTTNATALRTSMNRSYIENLTRREQEELEEEQRQRRRGTRLRKTISHKVALNESTSSHRETVRDRLRRLQEMDQIRQEQYEKELEDIRKRVEERPMLFEEEAKRNAKKVAEKKYLDTLKNAGIDEDIVTSYSSRTRSASYHDHSHDDYASDSFEDTAPKTEDAASGGELDYED